MSSRAPSVSQRLRASSRLEACSCGGCAAAGCSPRSGRRASDPASGRCRKGRSTRASGPRRRRRARWPRRPARRGASPASSATSATSTPGTASGSSRWSASICCATRAAGWASCRPRPPTRSTRSAGCRSRTALRCWPTAASARWLQRQSRPCGHYDPPRLVAGDDDAVYALNFYSPMGAAQLRSGRKTATIRLGDKSRKYRKGMIVQVLAGTRFSPRQKIFDAVIDKVEVKMLSDLSPREIEHDNPEIRRPEEMAGFLGQLYNREVADDELVTVIRFSEIRG